MTSYPILQLLQEFIVYETAYELSMNFLNWTF